MLCVHVYRQHYATVNTDCAERDCRELWLQRCAMTPSIDVLSCASDVQLPSLTPVSYACDVHPPFCRLCDSKARVLLTCSAVMRGPKRIELKTIADKAMALCAAQNFQVG